MASSRYEVELTLTSARDLKNVNWRYGPLRPYAVVWLDPSTKCSTKVDVDGDTNPTWEEKLTIPLPYDRRIEDSFLFIDIVHARSPSEDDTKPLIGSAKLPLREVVDEVGVNGKCIRSLKLKRPSGRPHGKLDVKVCVKDPSRYYDQYARTYDQSSSTATREYRDSSYGYAPAPPSGYPYSYSAPAPQPYSYGAPAPPVSYGAQVPVSYGAPDYRAAGAGYGVQQQPVVENKKSKFGMGTGIAVGAVGGILGGLALAEGADFVEDKIEDKIDERVDDDFAYQDGGYDDDY